MADMLLDITLFRDYLKGVPAARSIVEQVIDGRATASVSSVTVYELWQEPSLDRRTEMAYAALLSFLEEAPLSVDAAKRAGLLLAALDDERRSPLSYHALVAAVAQERGEPVCTRASEGFSAFHADVISY